MANNQVITDFTGTATYMDSQIAMLRLWVTGRYHQIIIHISMELPLAVDQLPIGNGDFLACDV